MSEKQVSSDNCFPAIYRSSVYPSYAEKLAEDSFIDAHSNLANGKSFCIEIQVVLEQRFFLKYTTGFQAVIFVFETPRQMFDFINQRGLDKFVEIFYEIK